MKRIYYILLLAGLYVAAACNKQMEVSAPTFDVSTDGSSFTAGKPVSFKITGNAHIISFYSGELLKDYAFKDGRTFDVSNGGITMQFTSSVQLGTQTNQLSILASTDFNGDYSSVASLKAATWTDITSRFVLGATASFTASGTVDISDLTTAGKPLYIAIRYLTQPQETNGLARQYFFQSFAIKSRDVSFNNAPLTIFDQNSIGFRIIDENKENAPARSSVTATRLTMYGNEYLYATLPRYDSTNPLLNPNNPIFDPQSLSYNPLAVLQLPFDPASSWNDPTSENWAVSRPITATSVDLGPDWSTTIKAGIIAAPITLFQYTYAKPGTYTATFVGSDNSIEQSKQTVKSIQITVQ